ncbi:CD5 antigen-like [Petromyzon marinus]|uniref:CD5 antigen-like n=1 Tax=Petromyzon marinus TaxID=7757 RepID=UPI003F7303A5
MATLSSAVVPTLEPTTTTADFSLRLAGGGTCHGRVEVFYEGTWGTVCGDIWGLQHAGVVCQQLGCGSAFMAPRNARFGPGSGQIWLDDVRCSGTESRLSECEHLSWGYHNCVHGDDASVVCSSDWWAIPTFDPTTLPSKRPFHVPCLCPGTHKTIKPQRPWANNSLHL